MSSSLSTASNGVGSLTGFAQSLNPLETSLGQDFYTGRNLLNPFGTQIAQVQGAGGNTFGAAVSQSQLAPSVNAGLFSSVGMGGLSPLMLLIILFVLGIVGFVIIKHI